VVAGPETTIRERLAWDVTPELYAKVRRLWIAHSKAEDGRDLDGLIATLSEDCVYEIVPTGARWEGHAGARSFYLSFLGAFPDVTFDLKDIVVGPQGVIEIATMRGTQRGAWQGQPPTGMRAELDIVIHFPWDPVAERFAGERIYYDSGALTRQLAGRS
jgi:predicted ester cyclase